MDQESDPCPICISPYDPEAHEPHIIPSCGHSLCRNCLQNFLQDNQFAFRCPLCNQYFRHDQRINLASFPKNFLAMNLIGTRESKEICPDHKSPLELVCVDCKKKICTKCAFKGEHKAHDIDIQEDFIKGIEEKVKDIENWSKEVEGTYSNICNVIEAKRKNLNWMIEIKFNTLFELLMQKKNALSENINQYFNQILQGTCSQNSEGLHLTKLSELRTKLFDILSRWREKPRLEAAFEIHFENLEGVFSSVRNQINEELTSTIIQALEQQKIVFESKAVELIESMCRLDCGQEILGEVTLRSQTSLGSIDDILSNEFSRNFETNIYDNTLYINSNSEYPDTIASNLTQESLKKVKDIKIKVLDFEGLNEFALFLVWIFNSVPGAESVELSLRNSSLDKDKLTTIFGGISSLFKLKELSIDIGKCENFDDEDLGAFSASISTLTQIRILRLNLTKCSKISYSGIRALAHTLQNMKHLNKLVINLRRCKGLTNHAFSALAKSLGEIRQLESLELVFTECVNLADETMITFANSLKTLPKLSKLNIAFSTCKIASKGFQAFAKGLGELTRTTQLCLFFDQCTMIRNEDLNYLAESLKKLQAIQSLYLSFQGCRGLSDQGFYPVYEGISCLENLSTLHMDLEGCSLITNQSLAYASEVLKMRSQLKDVRFSFAKCENIEDFGLENFVTSLQNLKNLEMLNLSFMGCCLLEGSIFSQDLVLSKQVQLHHLVIDLEGCRNLSQSALKNLSSGMGELKNLQRLRIYLKGCSNFDDECLKCVSESLGKLKSLSSVHFDLDECVKVSDQGVLELAKVLRNQENSSKDDVAFSIKKCPSVTPMAMYHLGLEIANLKRDLNVQEINLMFNENLSIEN